MNFVGQSAINVFQHIHLYIKENVCLFKALTVRKGEYMYGKLVVLSATTTSVYQTSSKAICGNMNEDQQTAIYATLIVLACIVILCCFFTCIRLCNGDDWLKQ